MAEKRLKKCVESLKKSECLEAYDAVFKEWLEEEIIEEIEPSVEIKSEHYLPHRAVLKENSTTKVRPVFDGSARERNCPSINDCLEKGPNTVELIPAVINRFRLQKIGVIADIRKAFLQIGLSERDRPFLKFLWWNDGDSANLRTFQHRRVVFGLSSSPYLLGATIQYHLQNASEDVKDTAQKLAESFYVDNCVTSVDNEEELAKFIEKSQFLLSSAKFDLRGWEHTPCCPDGERSPPSEVKNVPVLGLTWKLNDDSLAVDLKENPEYVPPWTKRKILSSVHKIFDPIGFTCPVTLEPKVMLQQCWKLNVTWDSELPDSITKQFEKWRKGLCNLKEIAIPRCLMIYPEMNDNLTLHVFCDSSQIAYATCIFLRCETQGSVSCQLVQARCRVAPMKTMSISRLELLACCIGARLAQSVKADLKMVNIPTFYWSDSGNALYWIKGKENWAPFVFNRVKEIKSLSDPENWNHVPGPLNPADLPSRGCNAEVLRRSRWWEGPAWLRNTKEEWPKSEAFPDFEIVNSERRKCVISATNVENSVQKIYDHSSYVKIVRVIAWIRRFVRNSRNKRESRTSDFLTSDEFNQAETLLLRIVQKEYFSGPEDKRLKALQCIVDSNGLLRVRSRILMREDSRNFRYPIVLPSDHHVVEKLIRSKHLSLGHAGVQILMCNLREDFWILKYRKTVRKVVRSCVRCKRFDSKPKPVPEAPLPEDRVREACVFEITGMDFAGPLILRDGQKVYIVIYTCAIFRAVHLELATALTTDNFLQTFRRFIARRGRPAIVYCDNGTNFAGAENILKKIDWNFVCKFSTAQKITWKFNPPSAPWWGGWWERLIGMMKRVLRKVLGRSSLNLEEMTTIICDTESIMNNRPLTYISDDVNDLAPLTPSMFLQELRESGIPDLDIIDSTSLNRRQTYRQKIKQDLRKRFRSEYLGQLRQSSKYVKNSEPIKVGDVVLVSSDNSRRLDWPMAKVIQVYPSKDGRIRLAKVKMKSGEFLRPVLRLIPLEVTEEKDDAPTSEEDGQLMPTFKKDLCPADSSANKDINVYPIDSSASKDTNVCPNDTKPNSELKRSRYGRLLRRRREFI